MFKSPIRILSLGLWAVGILLLPRLALGYTIGCTPEKGGTCYQASANQADIANAISAAKAGDTIRISPGTASFTTTIDVTKSLHIIGSGIGVTVIADQSVFTGTWSLSGTGFVRLSNFTLAGSAGSYGGSIRINGDSKRLDHIRFAQSGGRHPVGVYGNRSNVLIDHCVFEATGRGVNVFGSSSYWTDPGQYAPGTSYGVYIEDSTFNASGVEVVDLNQGGAYVVRHSKINNGGNLAVHGADSGERSGGYVEIYNNVFTNGGSKRDMMVVIRGGTAIISNNTATGAYNSAFKWQYWRSCYGAGSESQPFHESNKNRCQHNSVNPLDGDYSSQNNGWPCKDQPGTGPNAALVPMYQWNNTWDQGTPRLARGEPWSCTDPSTTDHVMEGRDYFNNVQKPGYTRYPYPHPLISGSDDGPPAAPTAPTNLKILAGNSQ